MAKKGAIDGLIDPIWEGLFGNTDEEDAAQMEHLQSIMDMYDGMQPPDLQNIDYDEFEYLGDLELPASVVAPQISAGKDIEYEGFDPRLAEIVTAGDSAFNDIHIDPRLREDQLETLIGLDEIVEGGGMTAADEANLNRILGQVSQADRGRREAIQQNMGARGMGGSGMDLLAQLDSSQAATDRANQTGLDIAAMAEDRALQALIDRGSMAGGIRNQDFGEAARIAEANDIIDRFNAQLITQGNQWNTAEGNQYGYNNAMNEWQNDWRNRETDLGVKQFNANNEFNANMTNAGWANDAATQSWMAQQGIQNMNTEVGNAGKFHNQYTIPNTQFGYGMDIAAGKSGAHGMMADYWGDKAAQENAKDADQLSGVIRGGAAIYTGGASEVPYALPNKKKPTGGQ